MKRLAATLALALPLLAGCAGGGDDGEGGLGNVLAMFSDFTLSDLKKANDIATAAGDQVGAQCFAFLIPIAERADQAEPGIKLGGVATLVARSRVARMSLMGGGQGGPCSALIREEIAFGLRVAGRFGLGAATGGAGLLGLGFLGL